MEERKFNEEKILLYKQTDDESIFEEIVKDKEIKNYISSVCIQKLKNYPSSMMDFNDFTSVAYLVLWQCIKKYKFICPVCGIVCKTESVYKMHTIVNHGEYIEPKNSISKYIKFNLGAYLQNELRREYSEERTANTMTISIFSSGTTDGDFDEGQSNDIIEYEISDDSYIGEDLIFKDCIKEATSKFDDITNEVFSYLYEKNMKQVEIAALFYEQGRYSSEQSAKVVISRIVTNKIYPIIREIYNRIS